MMEYECVDEVSRLITSAYNRDQDKPELKVFKEISRYSRKFGFPLVCTLESNDPQKQLHWAASLLLTVANTWPTEDIPEMLELVPGTALYLDARHLLEQTLGNVRLVRVGK